jgi:hypothetical protein
MRAIEAQNSCSYITKSAAAMREQYGSFGASVRSRPALRAAFGLAEVPAAELFLIALGAIDLLSDFASEHAPLFVVDDAQWLDRSTINILAIIARRLQSEQIVLLVASRDLPETPFADLIPKLHVEGRLTCCF